MFGRSRAACNQRVALKTITISLAVLLIQAFSIYFLGRLNGHFVEAMAIDSDAYGFGIVATILLGTNAGWLRVLTADRPDSPERFWMWNNLWFAVLGSVLIGSFFLLDVDGYWTLTFISLLYLLNSFRDVRRTGSFYFGLPAKTPK